MQVVVKGLKKVNYQIIGSGKPEVLLVHGWGGSSASLRGLANLLSNKTTVISMNLPGFGKSSLPDKDWGVAEYAQLIVDFLHTIKAKRCVYFGHSFGGALGIYLAANYPDTIDKLIVCAPSFKRTPVKKIGAAHNAVRERVAIPTPIKKYLYRLFFPNSDAYKFPKLESNFRKIVKQDLTPILPDINKETLVLWGDEDSYVNVADAQLILKNVKGATLKIYRGYGHNLPLVQPKLIYKDIEEFLKL